MQTFDPPEVEDTTVFPSEEDDAIREWKQEFTEQMRRAITRIHTNLGHPQNSTLAKMISDAGGSEKTVKCATWYPCPVCKRMSGYRGPDSSMTHGWLMCIFGITRPRGASALND